MYIYSILKCCISSSNEITPNIKKNHHQLLTDILLELSIWLPDFLFPLIDVYSIRGTNYLPLVGRERHCPINWYISDLDTILNSKGQIPLRWGVRGKKTKKWDNTIPLLSPNQKTEYGQSKIIYVYSSIFLFRVLLCIFGMCLRSLHELIDKSKYYMSHAYQWQHFNMKY
jgi:hypothetical protein